MAGFVLRDRTPPGRIADLTSTGTRFALMGCAQRRPRGRRFGCCAVRGHQSSDPRERSQIVEVDVLYFDSEAEALLELDEQLHELERVQNPGLEEIGVRGWHLDMEALDEQRAKALDDGVYVGQIRLL